MDCTILRTRKRVNKRSGAHHPNEFSIMESWAYDLRNRNGFGARTRMSFAALFPKTETIKQLPNTNVQCAVLKHKPNF